jgi:hypothetical protein
MELGTLFLILCVDEGVNTGVDMLVFALAIEVGSENVSEKRNVYMRPQAGGGT